MCNNQRLNGWILSINLSENDYIDDNGITLLLNTLDGCKNLCIKHIELSIDSK